MITFTGQLPRSIQIGGKNYAINTDYRIMADFETEINRADISDKKAFAEIFHKTISALFLEIPKADIRQIIDGVLWYYRCGKEPQKKFSPIRKRCYDYDEDSDYIFAAFMQTYGDDLFSSNMHWWEFRAKFTALTDKTEFVKIMQYRGMDISRIKNKEEKARIKKLQELFTLDTQKPRKFADLSDRDKAFRQRLQERYNEVRKQAESQKRKA